MREERDKKKGEGRERKKGRERRRKMGREGEDGKREIRK